MDAQELLLGWDAGHREPVARWAFTMLQRADSAKGAPSLLDRPVGERDTRLMALRNEIFGHRLRMSSRCPQCAAELDAELDARGMFAQPPASACDEQECQSSGYVVGFRLPTGRDLAAISDCDSVDEAAGLLLERCVTRAHRNDQPVDTASLPESVVDAINGGMAELDPGADVRIRVCCESCGHSWSLAFDVLSFVWHEIDVWARRMLLDVHRIAMAYGWTEEAILALSSARRSAYLALIGA
ncbi:MAG: hypothetical protein AB3X44_21545 [Leptothrix sp. (in: b-proteobacteria)]